MPMRARNIAFILCGVAALLLKPYYSGPNAELVHSYLGNFSISLAVYFLCANAVLLAKPLLRLTASQRRNATAVLALAIVAVFEETRGFGVMSNTYDPLDHAANAAGIVFAVLADAATARLIRGARVPPA
jgi:uncharacterized protein involved in response to NO